MGFGGSRPYKCVLEVGTLNVLELESWVPGVGVWCCPPIPAVVCFARLSLVCVSVHWRRECWALVVSGLKYFCRLLFVNLTLAFW